MFIIVFIMINIVATIIYIVFTKIGNVLKHVKYAWGNCYIIAYTSCTPYAQFEQSQGFLYLFVAEGLTSSPTGMRSVLAASMDSK